MFHKLQEVLLLWICLAGIMQMGPGRGGGDTGMCTTVCYLCSKFVFRDDYIEVIEVYTYSLCTNT